MSPGNNGGFDYDAWISKHSQKACFLDITFIDLTAFFDGLAQSLALAEFSRAKCNFFAIDARRKIKAHPRLMIQRKGARFSRNNLQCENSFLRIFGAMFNFNRRYHFGRFIDDFQQHRCLR